MSVWLILAISYGIMWLVARVNEYARNCLQYFHMLTHGLIHMVLSKEKGRKTFLAPSNLEFPEEYDIDDKDSRIIVFVRHGESVWNEIFNRGFDISFLGRLFRSLLAELAIIPKMDSVFFDTPLGPDGLKQAADMKMYLEDPERREDQELTEMQRLVIDVVHGEEDESVRPVFVSSNLRRALQTAVVFAWKRMTKLGQKLKILSSLQEISRNVDTQSILKARKHPTYSFKGVNSINGENFSPKQHLDLTESYGNKKIFGKGLDRQVIFCNWCFKRKENVIVVAGGHSLWFRSFFNTFLPSSIDHDARKFKMKNCGVVVFRLHKVAGDRKKGQGKTFAINPESIEVVYGGFVRKKGLMQ